MLAPSGASRVDPRCVISRALRCSIGMCVAVGRGEIDRRERRGDVERHVVRVRHHRHRVRADLVGDVAVRRDPVGADDDEVDVALAHERPGHALGDHGRRHVVAHQLPRREARALKERARLVGEHLRRPCPARPRRGSRRARCRSRPSRARRHCSASGCGRSPAPPRRRTGPSPGSSRRPRRESRRPRARAASLSSSTDSPPRARRRRTPRFMRSIAQNRLTAVGRVAAISSHRSC